MDSIPDISELLTTAPMALILLAFIWLVFKMLLKLITEFVKLMTLFSGIADKLIDVIKDLKR